MGIMTFLRNRAGFILIALIGLAILAFIISDVAKTGQPFWAASQNQVGEIDGHSIDYKDFQTKVEQQKAQLEQQYGRQNGTQVQAMAVENVWNQEVGTVLLTKEFSKVGVQVGAAELFDLIQGSNPSPLIRQYFSNPQTGQFNVADVRASLAQRASNPQLEQQWVMVENQIEQQALQQKYTNLLRAGIYVTNLEADVFNQETNKSANLKYVNVDYATVADKDAVPTDADYQKFYDENEGLFRNEQESRDFDYVVFSAKPSAQDSADVKKQVEKLAADFKVAANDSLFASVNSDVQVPFQYLTKGKLDPTVESAVFNLPAGSFYGPVLSNGSYKLAKVVSTTVRPDSVNAAHILLNPTSLGGVDKAVKLADSLKSLVQKGANFAELAKEYSTDGSKNDGGDLKTFSSDQMVPAFSDAAFSGKPGDLKIVTTQFGVHLIKINKVIGSSKAVKLAYIEKALEPSTATQEVAYKKASNFLNAVNNGTDFNAEALKSGALVQKADKILPTQAYIMGLKDPRKIIQEVWKAKKGDVLNQVFSSDNDNVVVKLNNVNPKGLLPLSAVKENLKPIVTNMAKARVIQQKMDAAVKGQSDIQQVATKLGATVMDVQNVVFANPLIGGNQEPEVVGVAFASKPNTISKPIQGQKGVYVLSVLGFATSAPTTNYTEVKPRVMANTQQAVLSGAMKVLQDKADITDRRVNFY